MFRMIRTLRCWLMRSHVETCRIVILPGVNMQHHMHLCVRCGAILWDKITSQDPRLPDYRSLVMGIDPEQQSRYMH